MARKVGKRDSRLLARLITEDRAPCAFCYREVDDEVTYGKLYAIGDIQCHYLCALLSCCLVQKGPEEVGLFGFMYKDILAELERSKKHKCSFCGRGGANLGCSVSSCRKQFHLPCGRDRNAVSLFYGSYKSFCQAHAPRQKIPEHIMCKAKLRMKDDRNKKTFNENGDNSEEEDMVCVICYESVDAFPTVNTFWPPCCARDAWFHRSCLQRMALSAGMHYLKCPLCNDKANFYDAVVSQGYYVPDRDAAWELEQNAFAELYCVPRACAASACACPQGRHHAADHGMWDIKLCLLCGSVGAHAQCIGASETTPYVCLTCTPAKPADMQALADTIDKLILQEQANSASNVRHGPLMPSRMSLRRTKGRLAASNRPSSSGACNVKLDCESPAQSPNIQSSRQELNLKTPRRPTRTDSNSPRKPVHTDSYKSPQKNTPIKLQEQSLNESYKHTDSYKNMEANHLSPKKLLAVESYKNMDSYKSIEASLLSPMKLLEQRFREKVVCMGGNAILDEQVVDILRRRFRKPRPLSQKKRIVDDIVNGLFNNLNGPLKQKEILREWCSPKKCYTITEEEENQGPNDNVSKASAKTIENKENCMRETPKKSQNICQSSTPIKVKASRLNDKAINVVEKDEVDGDEKHHENDEIKEIVDEKHGNDGVENIDGTHDDSSNSTFQLPSEFVAEDLSDDSSLPFQSPKRKTIEMKDSSLEISELDHSVNIDVIKVPDSPEVSPVVKKQCAFKFSPLDKEKLEEGNVGIDLESFKKGYLSEVDREYNCCFNHKHEPKNSTLENINFRSVIDFAVDAHFHKKATENKSSKKRKLSEGSLVLSFDKNRAKKRKMSENSLNLSFSSDDFDVKEVLRSTTKVESIGNIDKVQVNGRVKRRKKGAKERRKERRIRKKRYENLKEECVKNVSNDENKTIKEDQSLLQRNIEAKKQLIQDRKEEIEEEQIKNASNIENKNEKGEKSLLLRKQEATRQRIKDRKQIIDEKHKKMHKSNDDYRTVIKEKNVDRKQEIENSTKPSTGEKLVKELKEKRMDNRKIESKQKRMKDGEKHVQHMSSSNDGEKIMKYKPRVDKEARRRKDKTKNSEKHKVRKHKHSDKYEKLGRISKQNGDRNIEVTIDSSKSKSNKKTKTKLSISNNEKDISVKIKWKKKQLRFKIESKKENAQKVVRDSKFQQYVLQYFSEVTPKEVLVKPEKEVSPLKRKYVRKEKNPDKLKQMSISNFFKVKSPTNYD